MFADVFRHEWRLFMRNRAVAAVAFLYVIALPILSSDLLKGGTSRFFQQWQLMGIFIVLPMLFFGAQLVQRDEAARFSEILASLPVSNAALVFGKLAVGVIIVTAAALAQTVAGFTMATIQRVPLDLFLRGWAAVWPTSLLILVCAVLAGYTIALLAGRRAGLLFIGLYWLLPLFATAFLGSISARMHILRIFDMSGAWGASPSDMWGGAPERALIVYRMIFLIAVAGICLAGSLLTHERRRRTGLRRGALRVTSLALVAVLVLSVAGYASVYNTRIALAEGRAPGPDADTRSQVAVEAYDISLRLDGPRLSAETRLDIINAGQTPERQLLFTLRGSLDVIRVQWNGLPVSLRRAGDYITIDLPAAIPPAAGGSLNLTYAGPLADWDIQSRTNNDVNLRFGIGDGYAYLPYPAAWYPVAGHLRCAQPGRPRNGMVPHAPADFRLTVDDGGLVVASNLPRTDGGHFAGEGFTGVYLLAAPQLIEKTGDGFRMIHYTAPTRFISQTMGHVKKLVDGAARYLPTAAPGRIDVLALPEPFASSDIPVAPPGPDGTLVLAVSERFAGVTDVHPRAAVDDALLTKVAAWSLSPGLGIDDPNVSGALGLWLSLRLGTEVFGSEKFGTSYDNSLRGLEHERGTPSAAGIMLALDDRWRSGGAAAIREALRPLIVDPGMSVEEFFATLDEGAGR